MANIPARISLYYIIIMVAVAFLGYLIMPDDSTNANMQVPELALSPPGTKALLFCEMGCGQTKESLPHIWAHGDIRARKWKAITGYRFTSEGLQLQSGALTDLRTYRELGTDNRDEIAKTRLQARRYILGTDRFGRDLLSRLLLGARVSLAVGSIAVAISLLLGIFIGALAGFFRGFVDSALLWLMNVVWSIPTFLLVMAFSLVLGRGFWQIFIAVGLTMWVEVARIVRGQILVTRELDYVQAGRVLGFRNMRIITRHIIPNIFGPVLVISAANFASAIVLEAGLSFLGLGVQPPAPSWGIMVSENYGYLVMDKAWLAIIPGAAIALLVLAFNMLGNGLRDAYDVKG